MGGDHVLNEYTFGVLVWRRGLGMGGWYLTHFKLIRRLRRHISLKRSVGMGRGVGIGL